MALFGHDFDVRRVASSPTSVVVASGDDGSIINDGKGCTAGKAKSCVKVRKIPVYIIRTIHTIIQSYLQNTLNQFEKGQGDFFQDFCRFWVLGNLYAR